MLQKPMSQRMEDRLQTGVLDPALVAASFGAVVPVAEPLPELPPTWNRPDDTVALDVRAPRRPEPAPSLLEHAMGRLRSLRPITPERKQQVAEMIDSISEPLARLDRFVAEMEEEHFNAVDQRWENCRIAGRKLLDSVPALQREVAQGQQLVRESSDRKGAAKAELESLWWQRQRISQWANEREILDAEKKLADAKDAMAAATQEALTAMQDLADSESKLLTTRAHLQTLQTEMSRLQHELDGAPYYDPSLGLSARPTAYREKW